jgi:hypothetical protein
MNQHLAKAIAIYEQDNIDFQQFLTWHLCHGIVVCDMDCFAMGFSCNQEDPTQAVSITDGDALFVTFATGNISNALQKYLERYKYIAFQRVFKNSNRIKIYDIKKFCSKANKN